MKNFWMAMVSFAVLTSCESIYYPTNSGSKSPTSNSGTYENPNTSSPETEREYQELAKDYKQDTAGILSDLLNVDPNSPNASIVVENTSPCNIVLSVTGINYSKKIPIGVGQTRGVLVKKETYRLSSTVCRATYDEIKYLTAPYSIKLSNKN